MNPIALSATLPAMPDEIHTCSYKCDCGYMAHFPEDAVGEAKRKSLAGKHCLASGKHLVVFQSGKMASMLCPAQGQQATRRAGYTSKQGRYLAYIHQYTQLHGVPPAEAELQEFFKVSPPTVHQMVLTLERKGFIERTPGQARSIKVLVPPDELPGLT